MKLNEINTIIAYLMLHFSAYIYILFPYLYSIFFFFLFIVLLVFRFIHIIKHFGEPQFINVLTLNVTMK